MEKRDFVFLLLFFIAAAVVSGFFVMLWTT
jgi:hypothetical protein